MVNWDIPSLNKYVRKLEQKNIEELETAAHQWLVASAKNHIDYEIEWLGVPVIQTSEDLILMQELIFKIKPDYLVETGIAHGGSLIFYSSLFELLNKGHVIGVDIEIRSHNRTVIENHPMSKRITMIEGDSASKNIKEKINKIIPPNSTTIIGLDSNHYKNHVLKELNLYKDLVPVGSYIVVFDTVTSAMALSNACDRTYENNGPLEAIEEFIKENPEFIIDQEFNKLFTSTSQNGYLKRIK